MSVKELPADAHAAVALRRAAAVALIRLSGAAPQSRAALPDRTQAACARGLALALPKKLATPRVLPALLNPAQCATLIEDAITYGEHHGWGSLHRRYPTVDLPVAKLRCGEDVRATLTASALPRFSELFGAQYGGPLRFRDLFVAKYERPGGQAGLDGHVDASLLSLVLQLNPPDEFDGGGTFFEHCGLLARPQQGAAVLFLGKIYHAARPISSGRRLVLVALIDRDVERMEQEAM